MNRGDFILSKVRSVLADIGIFNVVSAQRPEIDQQPQIEAYPYIIKDTLDRSMMEDSRFQNQLHFVDVGIILRWNNQHGTNNRGQASERANDAMARIEAAFYTQDVNGLETTDGIRTHRIESIYVTESYGYMDTSLEVAETACLLTAYVTTTIN